MTQYTAKFYLSRKGYEDSPFQAPERELSAPSDGFLSTFNFARETARRLYPPDKIPHDWSRFVTVAHGRQLLAFELRAQAVIQYIVEEKPLACQVIHTSPDTGAQSECGGIATGYSVDGTAMCLACEDDDALRITRELDGQPRKQKEIG